MISRSAEQFVTGRSAEPPVDPLLADVTGGLERGGCDQGERDRRGRGRLGGDRGAASLLALSIGLMLVAGGVAGAAVGAAQVGRHQAHTAADFGALAGAVRAVNGESVACDRAAELVVTNGGRVVSCRLEGLELVVWVEVTVRPMPGLTRVATAGARAGPLVSGR